MQTGGYFHDSDVPSLTSEEEDVVRHFHDLYYRRWLLSGGDALGLSWFGYQVLKCPLDVWLYQELLVRTRPDIVVETGSWCGGSALFFAMVLEKLGHGRVMTIDIEPKPDRPQHPRLSYLTGSSTDPNIVGQVRDAVGKDRALVILDSDHSAAHVYQELLTYNQFVQVGDYLIVEDTNLNGHPVSPNFGPGPKEAVDRFLSESDAFAIDQRCERLLMTLNPGGYLKRVK